MSIAQHTPGPWVVTETRISGRLAIGWAEGTVAYAALSNDPETETADAHLIAAAPELLEACWAALGAANQACLSSADFPREELRAAIAKARGAA